MYHSHSWPMHECMGRARVPGYPGAVRSMNLLLIRIRTAQVRGSSDDGGGDGGAPSSEKSGGQRGSPCLSDVGRAVGPMLPADVPQANMFTMVRDKILNFPAQCIRARIRPFTWIEIPGF